MTRPRPIRCAGCGKSTPMYDLMDLGSPETGYKRLCGRCFNTEMAKAEGIEDFEHIDFAPMRIADAAGEQHEFHFSTRLFGTGVSLDAFELRDGSQAGYEFQVIGDPLEDRMRLLARLIEKMRRALAHRHLIDEEHLVSIGNDHTVRGRIEWDSEEDQAPLLVIDGRAIGWEHFGRMLLTYEGFQFKLTLHDKSEEC